MVARAAGKVRASPLVKNLNSRLRSDSFRRRTLPCCYPKNSDSEPGPRTLRGSILTGSVEAFTISTLVISTMDC